ncbi:MAG: sigma 54-interacting transcriptional regulator, partial [Thermoanaerobaculia bacterium]
TNLRAARPSPARRFFRTRNSAVRDLFATVEKIIDRDVPILILGESGAGKDHLAEIIHATSIRRNEPFVHVECASIPADLFESELFGHEKGTFTGASDRKLGKLEVARRGTVYFDEISALTPQLQAKLLRAMQERRFSRLGGVTSIPFDARVISSSNVELQSLLDSGALRRDLFYRINVVTLTLPPLRDRVEDILPLAKQFLGRRKKGFTEAAERLMNGHRWPGNIRELKNAIERAVLVENEDRIDAPSLGIQSGDELVAAASRGAWTLEELESQYIREILRVTKSNLSRAAEILGINRKTLREKRRKYGLS